jgi:hypothetical protein
VMFFVNNASRIMKFVDTVLDSVADIVRGNISGVVNKINDVLGQMVPILIGFLASVIGLGGIGQKIREIIQKLQKPITKALDFVIKTGLKLAAPIIRGLKRGAAWVKGKYEKGKAWAKKKVEAGKKWVRGKVAGAKERLAGKRPDGRSPEEKARAVTAALEESEALMAKGLPEPQLAAALPGIKRQHALTELRLVVEARTGATERVHVEGAASPGRRSRSSEIPTGIRWKFKIPEGPISALEGLRFPRRDLEGNLEFDEQGQPRERVVHATGRHVEVPPEFRDDPDEYLRRRIEGPPPAGETRVREDAGRFLDQAAMERGVRQAVATNQGKLWNELLDEHQQPKPVGTVVTVQCRVSGRVGVAYRLATAWYTGARRRAERVPETLVGVEVILILSHADPDEGIVYVVPETAYPIDTGER